MAATNRLKLLALLVIPALAPLAGCPSPVEGETVPPPYPVGKGIISTELTIASLVADGWTVCHEDNYAEQGAPVTGILAECTGSFMLVGCGTSSAPVLTLAAADARSTVTRIDEEFSDDTVLATDAEAHHVANGVGWYFNPDGGSTGINGSWGFFPAGEGVNRVPCDDSAAADGRRLCWRTASGDLTDGSRCGTELAPGATWTRYVLVHQGDGAASNPFASARAVAVGASAQATISSGDDVDYYEFTVATGGQTIRIQTFDSTGTGCDPIDPINNTGGRVDTYLLVYDSVPTRIATSDDSAPLLDSGWCEDFNLVLAEGTYYVAVGGWPAYTPPDFPFGYTLTLSDVTP